MSSKAFATVSTTVTIQAKVTMAAKDKQALHRGMRAPDQPSAKLIEAGVDAMGRKLYRLEAEHHELTVVDAGVVG